MRSMNVSRVARALNQGQGRTRTPRDARPAPLRLRRHSLPLPPRPQVERQEGVQDAQVRIRREVYILLLWQLGVYPMIPPPVLYPPPKTLPPPPPLAPHAHTKPLTTSAVT